MTTMLSPAQRMQALSTWEITAGTGLIALMAVLAVLGPTLATHPPDFISLTERLQAPGTPAHWLGTDQLGRDVWSRLLVGLRWSLTTALCATLLASLIGITLGLVAASQSGWIGTAIRQVTAFAQSFPVFVLAVSLVAIVGNGFTAVVLILGLVTWPVFCRVTQAEAGSLLQREYVLAARMMQVSRVRLYLWHVLPGLLPSLTVLLAFHFADMLIAESALSFLGIGAPLGTSTWGSMLNESRSYLLQAPWLLFVPALAVFLLVTAANLTGDGLRRRYA